MGMTALDRASLWASRKYQGFATAFGFGMGGSLREWTARDKYAMLQAYYEGTGVYRAIAELARHNDSYIANVVELRNPTFAAIEFYASLLWPGTLPDALLIETDRPEIIPAIKQLWKWSNFSIEKDKAARMFAMLGDMFFQVATHDGADGMPKRVFIRSVHPRQVTDFDVDERGFVTMLRTDTKCDTTWETQVWEGATWRKWNTSKGPSTKVDQLGDPDMANMDMPTGFVPWVHAGFISYGNDKRGMALIEPCMSKIDALNAGATRLAQMMWRHNKPTWALRANSTDSEGRPMPAPSFGDNTGSVVRLENEEMWRLPGNTSLESLVPQLDYKAFIESLDADYAALKVDLPELSYYDITARTTAISGVALNMLLAPAVNRLLEKRGVAEAALIRAHQIALTVGKHFGLDGFEMLGSFDNGDFDHEFSTRSVFPEAPDAALNRAKIMVEMGVSAKVALKTECGWNDDQLALLDAPTGEAVPAQPATVPLPINRPERGAPLNEQSVDRRMVVATASDAAAPSVAEALMRMKNDIADKAIAAVVASKAME